MSKTRIINFFIYDDLTITKGIRTAFATLRETIFAALEFLLGPLRGFSRALQGHQLAFLQSAQNHQILLVSPANLTGADQELLTFLHVHGGLALLQIAGAR